MSLFSYQGSFFVAVSAATSLLYQALFCLSRTFLTFFKSFLMFFFQTYSASIDSIIDFRYCQELFYFFEFFILFKRFKKNTEKEGFEPSHRANGLHP